MDVPSPCVRACYLDAERVCQGCRRTLDEIARWSRMTTTEKQAVWKRLHPPQPPAGPSGAE